MLLHILAHILEYMMGHFLVALYFIHQALLPLVAMPPLSRYLKCTPFLLSSLIIVTILRSPITQRLPPVVRLSMYSSPTSSMAGMSQSSLSVSLIAVGSEVTKGLFELSGVFSEFVVDLVISSVTRE